MVIANAYTNKYSSLVSVYFNAETQKIITEEGENSDYFTSDFTNESEMKQHLEDVGAQIEAEGAVLLENNGALPLKKNLSITLLGQDSVDLVYGGGGAGSVDTEKAVDLYTALEEAGYELNPVVKDFYENGDGQSYRKTVIDAYGQGEFAVNEVPVSEYDDEVRDSFADYNDAAIVLIGRSGGESADLTTGQLASGSKYLELDANEIDLINMASANFDKVIVLLNTQNPLEMGELKDLDVDAIAWIGALGETGAYGLTALLDGDESFSGRLVDTYAFDSDSAPAMANFGSYTINGSEEMWGTNYMVYAEGIYVGYKYYETRYEDVVLGNEDVSNYDYQSSVQYPFGYGLSYSSFEYSNYNVEETENTFEISVDVKNTGDVSSKEVVQIYMQSPYTEYDKENSIEKSAVELVGYGKTSELAPGDFETVAISIPKESMKAYDQYGFGTYILDAGDYYFAVGKNSHDALNNILSAKGYTTDNGMDYEGSANLAFMKNVAELDSTTYSESSTTNVEVSNQFEDVDIKKYDQDFTYLSRSDWTGTWPTTYADGEWAAPQELIDGEAIINIEDTVSETPITDTINDEYGQLNVAMLRDVDYDDPLWDVLIQQMSVEELDGLIRVGGYGTAAVDSIQLPATVDKDGTAGISSTLVGGENGMAYPPEIVLASTWNKELAEEFGKCIGEDSINLSVAGWYAPAMNIHRTPYSGRNFEYYSEDGYLSGEMGAATVIGAQSKGAIVTIKHFALNDQETNRMGVNIFANEQSIREIYLKAFEAAVTEADAHGVMASMNRIGNTWTGGHVGLMTNVLRNEWGYEGFVITDQASYAVFAYEDLREGLAAGTSIWLNSDTELWKLSDADMNNTVISNMQRAAKDVVFAISRSNAMNGLSAGAKIVQITPWWKYALYALFAILTIVVLIPVVFLAMGINREIKKKRTTAFIIDIVYSVLLFGAGLSVILLTSNDSDLSAEFMPVGLTIGIIGLILTILLILINKLFKQDDPELFVE
jgi:beta-glucosidase